MKRSKKASVTNSRQLALVLAKLVFYLALAVFTKAQFDEMGTKSLETGAGREEPTKEKALPKADNEKAAEKTAQITASRLTNYPE